MRLQRILAAFAGTLLVPTLMPIAVHAIAAPPVIVRPSSTQGWTSTGIADTRSNGHLSFVADASSPYPKGALSLVTDPTPAASQDKVQYLHATNTKLSAVAYLAYSTKQNSASFNGGDPSYQVGTCLYGLTAGACTAAPVPAGNSSFTTFVYEPYENGTVVNGVWQSWNVSNGLFWSSKTSGPVTASQGTFMYSLATLKADFPNAVVYAFGVNVGSNNPGYNTEVDALSFNPTVYDFEQDLTYPNHLSDCEGNNWQQWTGKVFKNRVSCIEYVYNHAHEAEGDVKYTANGLVRHATFDMDTYFNRGTFNYSDKNGGSYKVTVSEVSATSSDTWFAGIVSDASTPAWNGLWLFGKVENAHPDKIWGSFTDQTTAVNGAKNMSTPADGPFNITSGNLKVSKFQ